MKGLVTKGDISIFEDLYVFVEIVTFNNPTH